MADSIREGLNPVSAEPLPPWAPSDDPPENIVQTPAEPSCVGTGEVGDEIG